jgi:hypothetical protein
LQAETKGEIESVSAGHMSAEAPAGLQLRFSLLPSFAFLALTGAAVLRMSFERDLDHGDDRIGQSEAHDAEESAEQ